MNKVYKATAKDVIVMLICRHLISSIAIVPGTNGVYTESLKQPTKDSEVPIFSKVTSRPNIRCQASSRIVPSDKKPSSYRQAQFFSPVPLPCLSVVQYSTSAALQLFMYSFIHLRIYILLDMPVIKSLLFYTRRPNDKILKHI